MKKFKDLTEQHSEKGRFKPVIPKIVKNKAILKTRPKSDSADVKLREGFDICDKCQADPCICDESHGFINETQRMSAAVKLQRALERERQKSEDSRRRAEELLKPKEPMKKEEVQQVDEIVKPDVKNDIKSLDAVSFAKKHGVKKGEAKSMAEESSMAEKQAQKQYRDARKNDVPFDPPYSTKKSATPGKFGSGYSTARHLARQAMQKQAEKTKNIKQIGLDYYDALRKQSIIAVGK